MVKKKIYNSLAEEALCKFLLLNLAQKAPTNQNNKCLRFSAELAVWMDNFDANCLVLFRYLAQTPQTLNERETKKIIMSQKSEHTKDTIVLKQNIKVFI